MLEFMYLVFTRMPGESYRRRHRSLLLWLCDVFRALINSLVCGASSVSLALRYGSIISCGVTQTLPALKQGEYYKTNCNASII